MVAEVALTPPVDAYGELQGKLPPGWTMQRVGSVVAMCPRPRDRHALAHGSLFGWLNDAFHHRNPRRRGPGGWVFRLEPELHLGEDVLVPDIAGWKLERFPNTPDAAFLTVAPDWVCEVLSPGTELFDRGTKGPAWAKHGTPWVWMVDPEARLLEVFRSDADGRLAQVSRGSGPGRFEPFAGVELDPSELWQG